MLLSFKHIQIHVISNLHAMARILHIFVSWTSLNFLFPVMQKTSWMDSVFFLILNKEAFSPNILPPCLHYLIPTLSLHWLFHKQEYDKKKMRAEWRDIFQEMRSCAHLCISTSKRCNTSWNITRFEIMTVFLCVTGLCDAQDIWCEGILCWSNQM